jgi:hypothetical protein
MQNIKNKCQKLPLVPLNTVRVLRKKEKERGKEREKERERRKEGKSRDRSNRSWIRDRTEALYSFDRSIWYIIIFPIFYLKT